MTCEKTWYIIWFDTSRLNNLHGLLNTFCSQRFHQLHLICLFMMLLLLKVWSLLLMHLLSYEHLHHFLLLLRAFAFSISLRNSLGIYFMFYLLLEFHESLCVKTSIIVTLWIIILHSFPMLSEWSILLHHLLLHNFLLLMLHIRHELMLLLFIHTLHLLFHLFNLLWLQRLH
jgi:hypothetical protein